MKIGYFTTHFPYDTPHSNYYCAGVEIVASNLVANMSRRGHQISVFTTANSRRSSVETSDSTSIHRYGRLVRIGQTNLSVGLMYKPLKQNDVDIVHAHMGNPPAPISAMLYAKRKNKPFILTYHGDPQHDWGGLARRMTVYLHSKLMLHRILSRAEVIISPSEHFIDESKVLRKYRSKTIAIPNGIDISDLDVPYSKEECRGRLGLDKGEHVILFVGGLSPYKGPDVLIRAMPKIMESLPNSRLVLVGEGTLREKLEQETKELGIDQRVQFTGFVKDNLQKAMFFHAADVFVLPSVTSQEIFGIVNLEAMAAGVPIVASKIGGIPDVVTDGDTGLLVPPNDPDAIAKAVVTLISDPELGRAMVERGLKRVEAYSWASIAERTEKIYEEAIA
jgi:glycosyltransferase involved in cell wall biosynthesis